MAIKLVVETDFGCDGNYHRPTNINIDLKTNRVNVVMETYLNEEARRKGCVPLESNTIQFGLEVVNEEVRTSVSKEVYDQVKKWRSEQPDDCEIPEYHKGENV